jgi:hypothetical protein
MMNSLILKKTIFSSNGILYLQHYFMGKYVELRDNPVHLAQNWMALRNCSIRWNGLNTTSIRSFHLHTFPKRVYAIPSLRAETAECLNQSLFSLLCLSWQLIPSQLRTSRIPRISLFVCMCFPTVVARQRLLTRSRGNEYKQQRKICYTLLLLCGRCLIKGESARLPVYATILVR